MNILERLEPFRIIRPNPLIALEAKDFEESVTPQCDRCVVMIVAGDDYAAQAEITAPRAKAYASRIGGDFHLLSGDRFPEWPMANKFRFASVARHYEQSLLIDCDVWIHDHAADIFDACLPGVSMIDETELLWAHAEASWIEEQGRRICEVLELELPNSWRSGNGGVIVLDYETADLYRAPEQLPTFWCAEQQMLTLRAQAESCWNKLDHRFNWTFVRHDFWRSIKHVDFVHVNGAKPESYRLEVLRRFACGNFERFDPPADSTWIPKWNHG